MMQTDLKMKKCSISLSKIAFSHPMTLKIIKLTNLLAKNTSDKNFQLKIFTFSRSHQMKLFILSVS